MEGPENPRKQSRLREAVHHILMWILSPTGLKTKAVS